MASSRITAPSGFPEHLPEEQLVEDQIRDAMHRVYGKYGYVNLETPAVESMLALKGSEFEGDDVGKEIYGIQRAAAEGDGEEARRGLRFDLTVPLARYVAEHQGRLKFPFKRRQIQKVWRGERAQAGRFREFYQADIDVIGDGKLPLHFDAEVVEVVHALLEEIDIGGFTIHLNHRKLLQGLIERAGGPSERLDDALRIIDKIDKVGRATTATDLVALGMEAADADRLLGLLDQRVSMDQVESFLASIEAEGSLSPLLSEGIAELREVSGLLSEVASERGKIVFNPKIARGLGYYTGSVYETTLDGLEKYGSICSGGRYANLAERFTDRSLPGVGISIGLSRLMSIIKTEGLKPFDRHTETEVMIGLITETQRETANRVARALRAEGFATEIYHDGNAKLAKQIKFAEAKGIPHMVLLNDNGSFELKDLAARQQATHLTVDALVAALARE